MAAVNKKTMKSSGTQAVGTKYYPDSLAVYDTSADGFDLSGVDEEQLNKVTAFLNAAAGVGGSTIDVTVQLYDGSNWFDATGISGQGAFAQVGGSAVKTYLPILGIGRKIRFKVVVGTADSSAFGIDLLFKGQQGAYSA